MTEVDSKVEREAWAKPALENIGDAGQVANNVGAPMDLNVSGDTSS